MVTQQIKITQNAIIHLKDWKRYEYLQIVDHSHKEIELKRAEKK